MTSKDDEYDYLFKGIFIRFYFSLQTSYTLHWTEVLMLLTTGNLFGGSQDAMFGKYVF